VDLEHNKSSIVTELGQDLGHAWDIQELHTGF